MMDTGGMLTLHSIDIAVLAQSERALIATLKDQHDGDRVS